MTEMFVYYAKWIEMEFTSFHIHNYFATRFKRATEEQKENEPSYDFLFECKWKWRANRGKCWPLIKSTFSLWHSTESKSKGFFIEAER